MEGSAYAPPIQANGADCDSQFWREQAPTKTENRSRLIRRRYAQEYEKVTCKDKAFIERGDSNMGMTPDQFFEAFVFGNYEDCQQYPGCVRRAFNAAVSASHLADHYFAYWQKHNQSKVKGFKAVGNYVEDLSTKTDGCFRDIRSISNAYKHLYTSIDLKKGVHSSISSTGAIESITLVNEDVGVKVLDSTGNNHELKVVYTRKDGQRMEFLPTLHTVIKYWETNLY